MSDMPLIERTSGNMRITFRQPVLGESAFDSIDAAVKEAAKDATPLTLDLSHVQRASGDFFGYLVRAYGNGLPALSAIKSQVTLILDKQQPVYKTADAFLREYATYDFVRYAA